MAQFDGGKYKGGILSYNYLGEGEEGVGRGPVFIKKGKGGDWYFVDKSGKVRKDVGIEGKLTPTHIQNLKDDNIFAAAEINSDGTKLSKAKIKADTGGEYTKETEIVSTSGDGVGITSEGIPDGTTSLAESNISLPEKSTSPVASIAPSPKGYPISTTPSTAFSPKNEYTRVSGGNMPTGYTTGRPTGGKTAYERGEIGSGYSENTQYIPPEVPSEANASPGRSIWAPGAGEYSVRGSSTQGNMPMNYSSDSDWSQDASSTTDGGFTTSNFGGEKPMGVGDNAFAPIGQPGGSINSRSDFAQGRIGSGYVQGVKIPSDPNLQTAMAPGLDQKTLTIGEGGDPGLYQIDDDFYRTKDGTLMKDGGWFTGDTAATQADIDAGIIDQASPGMTSAAGWNAAGSVMKGVGGLASAYTGFKNYELARDAHDTQKAQWQLNYDQQLKAFEQNKKLANQDIASRNRTLLARNPNRTDLYKEL